MLHLFADVLGYGFLLNYDINLARPVFETLYLSLCKACFTYIISHIQINVKHFLHFLEKIFLPSLEKI